MHARDPLEAHLRDELGQTPQSKARPMQAALASAASFTMGGLIPFAGAFAPTPGTIALSIVGFALAGLLVTGILSAKTAGKACLRTDSTSHARGSFWYGCHRGNRTSSPYQSGVVALDHYFDLSLWARSCYPEHGSALSR